MIRYTVNNYNSWLNIPLYVTALTVTDNSCNENNIGVVDLNSFKFLRSVVIGRNCFQHVQEFSIVGLNWLESVSIGSSSFRYGGYVWVGSEFKIVNCPQLKSLRIGDDAFSGYVGFELSQLPQLKSVEMNRCFVNAPEAVFRGMNDYADGLKICHHWRASIYDMRSYAMQNMLYLRVSDNEN